MPLPLIAALVMTVCPPGATTRVFVSPSGSDSADGDQPDSRGSSGPVATIERGLERAQQIFAKAGGRRACVAVEIRSGTYFVPDGIHVTGPIGGAGSLTVESYGADPVRVIGGVAVDACLPSNELGPVKCRLLPRQVQNLKPGFEVFWGHQRLSPARWPNVDPKDPRGGWTYIRSVDPSNPRTSLFYAGERPRRWANAKEAVVHVWPSSDWFDEYVPLAAIRPDEHRLVLARPTSYPLEAGRRFYVENLREELDAPGEWYLDRTTGTLLAIPPRKSNEVPIISSADAVVSIDSASNVTVRGLTIDISRGSGIVIRGGMHNRILASTVSNTRESGIRIEGGTDNGAIGNDIYDTGAEGIVLQGGDRRELRAARNFADDDQVYRFGSVVECYRPGISVSGMGNRAAHNLIHDGPHAGVIIAGNDNLVEANDLYRLCLDSSDCGAIYTGRDWSFLGNAVRFNRVHDISGHRFARLDSWSEVVTYEEPGWVHGTYLDDAIGGVSVIGNEFFRVGGNEILVGGGHENVIEGNVFVGGDAIHVDNRWKGYDYSQNERMLDSMPHASAVWRRHYPHCSDPRKEKEKPIGNVIRHNVFALPSGDHRPLATYEIPPDGNLIDDNLLWSEQTDARLDVRLLGVDAKARPVSWVEWRRLGFDRNSLVANPRFVAPSLDDFRLAPGSPAFKIGFRAPPLRPGLYRSRNRATWPPPITYEKIDVHPREKKYPLVPHAAAR
jgi:hypothetical protein